MKNIFFVTSILIMSFLFSAPAFSKSKKVNNGKGATILAKCMLEGGTLSGKSFSKCCSVSGSSSYCISCPEKKADRCTITDGIFPVDQHSNQKHQPSTPVKLAKLMVVQTAPVNKHPVDSKAKKIDIKLCEHTGGTFTKDGPLTICLNGDGTTTTVCNGHRCVSCKNGNPECKYIRKEHSGASFPKPSIQQQSSIIISPSKKKNETNKGTPFLDEADSLFSKRIEAKKNVTANK